jgi:AcrR family transcriptional regulator
MKDSEKGLKRRERKKKETRDAIFKIAHKLFKQKGFEDTSVEDITERVDIAQSTFFNYFPRKEDILVEIFKRKLPFLKMKCQEILQSDESIKTKIHKIFSTTAVIAAKNESISRAMMIKNFSSFSNTPHDGVFFEGFRSALSLVLKKGQEEGQIRSDIPAIKLANMLEGIFTLFVIDCLIKKASGISSRELLDRLTICLEGMMTLGEGKTQQ